MPSFLSYPAMAGDQVVVVQDGTYTGGTLNVATTPGIAHPETTGPYKGFLVLIVETPGGVTIIPENTAIDTQSVFTMFGAERILFVGINTDGIVNNLFGTDYIWHWYCDYTYEGSDHPLFPGGANYGYSPTTFIIANSNGRGNHNRWYGCDFHTIEDDAFRVRQQNYPLWQGCHWLDVYHTQGNFNYHSDSIQTTGAITGAQILDGHMDTGGGTGFMCGIENSNPQSIDVVLKRVWIHGSYSYGTQFFIREEATTASITAYREAVHTWNTGGSPGNPGYTTNNLAGPGASISVTNVACSTTPQVGTSPSDAWRAVSGQGYDDWASFLGFSGGGPLPMSPPSAPTNVSANAPTTTSIQVQWVNGTGTIDRTIIEYGTGGTFTSSITVTGTGQTVTIAVASGTTYNVRVRHQNSSTTNGGYSSYSSPTVTVTTPTPTTPPTGPPSTQSAIIGTGPTGASLNSATLTLTSRVDVELDDLMIAWISGHSALAFPLTLPSGWADVPASGSYTPASEFGAHLAYKLAEAADVPADASDIKSYVFTHDSSYALSQSFGKILVIRGADTGDPFNVVGDTENIVAALNVVSPVVVTDVDYTLFIVFIASDNGATPVQVTSVGPASFTEMWDISASGSPFSANSAWWVSGGVAGSKAAQTAVLNQSQEAVIVAVAIAPAGEWTLPDLAPRIPLGAFGDNQVGATIALIA